MTIKEALEYLDTIPTIGEQVDALEIAIRSLEAWEKVRKEIDECIIDYDLDFGNEMFYNNAILDVLKIIDNHLAEMSE